MIVVKVLKNKRFIIFKTYRKVNFDSRRLHHISTQILIQCKPLDFKGFCYLYGSGKVDMCENVKCNIQMYKRDADKNYCILQKYYGRII